MKPRTTLIPLLAVTALACGCANAAPHSYNSDRPTARSSQNRSIGVIESIEGGRRSRGHDSALLGTVVGGVAGAAVGHGVGKGHTRDVATVAGALGGAVLGRKIDKAHDRKRRNDAYVIGVRFNDGSQQTVTQDNLVGLRVGDRVRMKNGDVRKF
jgi:outer membrane lipoprotein SlyB